MNKLRTTTYNEHFLPPISPSASLFTARYRSRHNTSFPSIHQPLEFLNLTPPMSGSSIGTHSLTPVTTAPQCHTPTQQRITSEANMKISSLFLCLLVTR